ncbi:MAG: radical SAM protein [Thermoguttaceae bacterium]
MTIHTQLPLSSFAEYVRVHDDHAAYHLALLKQADELLASGPNGPAGLRRDLSVKLERWRYQYLNQRGGHLTPEDWRLVDALDLASNELAGRPARPPRSPRRTLRDLAEQEEPVQEVRDCLDPALPLEAVAARAAALTQEHFGVCHGPGAAGRRWRMLLYAPLYLSNYCVNHCLYCGFRYPHRIQRRHLSVEEALREAALLRSRGFRHLLLVAGDFPSLTTPGYYAEILRALRAQGIVPAIEIAPQNTDSYAALAAAGAIGVTLYQETYLEPLYARYHPRGSKVSYDWRLEGLERAAEAGMRRLGLGILLGLADPHQDLVWLIRHGQYLAGRFPDRTLAFSLPRIHDAPEGFQVPFPVDDETFIRMYCALRLAFPRAHLVLSTREPEHLRNRLAGICITQMSAGSRTAPGGYEDGGDGHRAGAQFPVSDRRSPAAVAAWLSSAGFEVAWEIRP